MKDFQEMKIKEKSKHNERIQLQLAKTEKEEPIQDFEREEEQSNL